MVAVAGKLPDGRAVRVHLAGSRIAAVEPATGVPDVVICPGLIDLQVNGYGGHDVNADDLEPDTVRALVYALRRRGVTSFCPTLISAPEEKLLRGLSVIAAARADPEVAHAVVGVHVEGPYLSPADGPRGAHEMAALRDPAILEFGRWQRAAGGLVRIVTVAPERDGADEYIAHLAAAGVVASIGHSAATRPQIRRAVAAGARMSTHLGNGTSALLPRHDNVLWPQLAADELTACFIADGHHLPGDALTAMVRAKGVSRSILVSDATALAGRPPGRYASAVGADVTVEPDGRLTLTGTPYLAGSGAALDECLAWTVRHTPFGLADAIRMTTVNPARLLSLTDRGRLRPGAIADLITLPRDGSLERVMVAGREMTP